MSIPGFGGDFSLYKTNLHYRAARSGNDRSGAQRVISQLLPQLPDGGGGGQPECDLLDCLNCWADGCKCDVTFGICTCLCPVPTRISATNSALSGILRSNQLSSRFG
jgi:hypothetical protein